MRKTRFIENCRCYHQIVGYIHQPLGCSRSEALCVVHIGRSFSMTTSRRGRLLEKGVIARTDPDHPQSPQQTKYVLEWDTGGFAVVVR